MRSALAYALSLSLLALLQGCNPFGGDDPKEDPPTDRGFFLISSPKAGGRVGLDSAHAILWSPSEAAAEGNVKVTLHRGEEQLAVLSSSALNTGALNWRPATVLAAAGYRFGSGSDYRIRIASVIDTGEWDYSGTFSLYSAFEGTLQITTPAAGAEVRMDTAYGIRWTMTGDVGPTLGIQLYKDTVLVSTPVLSALPSGYYLWSNPGASLGLHGSGNDYRLRVFSMSDPSIDAMSAPFSLVSTYTGSFDVTSPQAGDTLTAGISRTIAWTATGNPGSSVRVALLLDSTLVSTLTSAGLPTGTLTWTPSAGLVSSDRYRIRVTSAFDAGIAGHSGYFAIKGVDADGYEVDNTLATAKALPVTGEAQQRTLTASDQDWAAFQAVAGRHYLVSARPAAGTLSLGLYDSAGGLIQSGTSGTAGRAAQIVYSAARSGRHYARVSGVSGYGSYALSATESDTAFSLYAVRFTAPTEITTWAAGTTYAIQYVPDTSVYGSMVTLSLYQDSTLVQSIVTGASNTGSYSWTVPASIFSSDRYRIRIQSYSYPQTFAYSPRFTISGTAPDAFEPDNARTTAKALPADGKPQARTLNSADTDWIRIQAQAGKRYLAAVNAAPGSVYGYLLDSLGSQLSVQSGSQFTVVVQPTYTGDYYLRVMPYSSGISVSYTVTLAVYDSAQAGFPARFSSPDSTTTWASGSAYALAWTPDPTLFGSTVSLSLYQDSAFVRSIATGISNSGTYSWSIPLGLPSSGRYRIRMANYSASTVWGFSPYFTISGLAPDAYEPDNARAGAKTLVVDGPAQQRSLSLNDTDWVAFEAAAGRSYLVTAASAASSTLYLYLLDSLGSQISVLSGVRPTLVLAPTRSGRHYARVQYYSSTGAYALSVSAFNPEGVQARFTAPVESTTWAAGSAYAATWTPDSSLFGPYVNLALYRDSTLVLSLASSAANSGSLSVTLPATLGSSNRYRLRLANYNTPQIFGFGPYFTVSGIAADSLEPNDSASTARPVAPNSGRRSLSLSYRDRDWFRFTGKAQMLYLIQAVSPSTLNTTLRLYSGAGTSLLTTATKASTLDSLNGITWVPTADGALSVMVEPSSTTYAGNYGFEIKELDPATYRFNVTAPAAGAAVRLGGSLAITWTDPAGLKGTVDIFLYDAAGVVQTIIAGASNTGTYTWTVPSGLAAKADYHIRINHRTSPAVFGTSGNFSLAP